MEKLFLIHVLKSISRMEFVLHFNSESINIFKKSLLYLPVYNFSTISFFLCFVGSNDVPLDKRDSMVGLGFKKESCCLICEEVSQQNNILVKCKGSCQGSYHISCLGKEKICALNL